MAAIELDGLTKRYESGGTDPSIVELMRWAEVLGVPFTLSFDPQTEAPA